MNVAVAKQFRHPTVHLAELAGSLGTSRVDVDSGIVHDVKVIGFQSVNLGRTVGCDYEEFGDAVNKPYRYSKPALEAAAPLYEGIPVFVDHVEFEHLDNGERRPVRRNRNSGEKFGWLANVRVSESGLVADLHYLKSHEFAPRFIEAAQRNPAMFCLSHNAFAEPELVGGEIVFTKIHEVKSVDIVGERPGTTKSLFESEAQPVAKRTWKQIVESHRKAQVSKAAKAIFEMMDDEEHMLAEEEVPADMAEAPSADESAKAAFRQMIVDAFDDESLDVAATAAKIKEILKAYDKLTAPPEAPADPAVTTESEDDPAMDEDKEKAATESAARARDDLLSCVKLLNEAGRPASEANIELLSAVKADRRKALVESLAPAVQPKTDPVPRSQSPRRVSESAQELTAEQAQRELRGW